MIKFVSIVVLEFLNSFLYRVDYKSTIFGVNFRRIANPAERGTIIVFAHDVLLAGGINEIIVGGQNVIDISDIVSSVDYRLEIRKILIDHNKNPDLMSYYSIEPRLHDLPLPVNIAPAYTKFLSYYYP